GLPLVIAAPVIGLLLNLDAPAEITLVLTLLVGTPALTFIGLIGAAIAVTLRRGGLLLAVIVLPLTVPVLIFGVAAANTVGPTPLGTPFTILCALTLASLVIGPFAAAAALRQEMEEGAADRNCLSRIATSPTRRASLPLPTAPYRGSAAWPSSR